MYRCIIKRTLVTSHVQRQRNEQLSNKIKVKSTRKEQQRFSKTVLLPRTEFPVQLNGKERIEKDAYLAKNCGFAELYEWQREHLSGPDFVLHDGPPYANGSPHMGHAINKILKDVTLRYNILRRNRVHYVPGWDCHGLPVELKANKSSTQDPLEIRKKARAYAAEAIAEQKRAFISWGVTADWSESGCYLTNRASYMKNQLCQFVKLYEKGVVFRDFMPVHWSPSSRSALAESELQYNQEHRSRSVIFRLRVDNIPSKSDLFKTGGGVYALIWTTTPWSLVANQAVAFSPNVVYCIAEDSRGNRNVVADSLLGAIEQKVGPLKVLERFKGRELEGGAYFHPFSGERCPFLAGRHVSNDVGTGLVHTAPAHGVEDFVVAIENSIPVLSLVDGDGRYTEAAGPEFHGLEASTEGVDKVLELAGRDVLHTETITHSCPYDWRTKEPTIVRASNQWFIDINSVKEKVMDSVADINVYPECNRTSFTNAILAGVKNRPYWCISRQRSWGTPIPVLYNKKTGEAFTNRELVERLCRSIDRYGPDCWWEYSVEELIGVDAIEKLNVPVTDVEKGKDIMDIWFDSGISWSAVLPEGKANLYLEGYDQFGGWFQSSLITSVALQGCPPYSGLYVHGFAVDENGLKMSKSVGNVTSPDQVLLGGSDVERNPIYGVDVLRWWVANHGAQQTQIPVSKEILDGCKRCVDKLRLILRFLLGVSYPYHRGTYGDVRYRTIDRYMLLLLYRYNEQVQEHYNNYEYHQAGKRIMHFVANDVSALYCSLIKDRVYCDEATSATRVAAVQVVKEIFRVLTKSIAPILPHLAEEAWLHCPDNPGLHPLHCTEHRVPECWNVPEIEASIEVALRLRNSVSKIVEKSTWKFDGAVEATREDFSLLRHLQNEHEPSTSELCELLQLSSVTVEENDAAEETQIRLSDNNRSLCLRCRRYSKSREDGLCVRCIDVLRNNETATAIAK